MNESPRPLPIILDTTELHLRLPVRKADDPLMRQAGADLPILRVM